MTNYDGSDDEEEKEQAGMLSQFEEDYASNYDLELFKSEVPNLPLSKI